jgi:tetratricopeptide (TPR) repeat protein
MAKARALDPKKRETALVLGISQYTVSTLSWPVRVLVNVMGLSGDRETGLRLLEEAASDGAETETDARLLLMLVENREDRPADALRRLASLQRAHPGNRLLWLNQGASALAAGQPQEAEQMLSKGIAGRSWDTAPAVIGEAALWLAHRGTARARLHRSQDAVADLERALTSMPRDWVRGRIHAELAELAVAAGERERARQQYEDAIRYSERGGDASGATRVRQKLNALRAVTATSKRAS